MELQKRDAILLNKSGNTKKFKTKRLRTAIFYYIKK